MSTARVVRRSLNVTGRARVVRPERDRLVERRAREEQLVERQIADRDPGDADGREHGGAGPRRARSRAGVARSASSAERREDRDREPEARVATSAVAVATAARSATPPASPGSAQPLRPSTATVVTDARSGSLRARAGLMIVRVAHTNSGRRGRANPRRACDRSDERDRHRPAAGESDRAPPARCAPRRCAVDVGHQSRAEQLLPEVPPVEAAAENRLVHGLHLRQREGRGQERRPGSCSGASRAAA